jgi:hypothetical protein
MYVEDIFKCKLSLSLCLTPDDTIAKLNKTLVSAYLNKKNDLI